MIYSIRQTTQLPMPFHFVRRKDFDLGETRQLVRVRVQKTPWMHVLLPLPLIRTRRHRDTKRQEALFDPEAPSPWIFFAPCQKYNTPPLSFYPWWPQLCDTEWLVIFCTIRCGTSNAACSSAPRCEVSDPAPPELCRTRYPRPPGGPVPPPSPRYLGWLPRDERGGVPNI